MRHTNSSHSPFEPSAHNTQVSNQFFSELLPEIDHLGELKLTLYAIWAFEKRDSRFQYLRKTEMAEDNLLIAALKQPNLSSEESLEDSIERTIARGTLIQIDLTFTYGSETFYFLNNRKGQAAVKAIQDGKWQPGDEPDKPIELRVERPNIFTLYEQNIGPLTPMIAETLKDAEEIFPESWIEEAIGIAVENNVRKWSYINAILDGWQTRGKDAREDRGDSEKARRRYLKGWFDD
ncbi:MAG: DnaD domain protein [Anaerolineales bacterium]|nr:DnaD domain protein [Anaerolineales bacterium]